MLREQAFVEYFIFSMAIVLLKRKQNIQQLGFAGGHPPNYLISRSEAYVWQSGRDAQFSSVYGRMWQTNHCFVFINIIHVDQLERWVDVFSTLWAGNDYLKYAMYVYVLVPDTNECAPRCCSNIHWRILSSRSSWSTVTSLHFVSSGSW